MAKCEKCGTALREGAGYCNRCGAEVKCAAAKAPISAADFRASIKHTRLANDHYDNKDYDRAVAEYTEVVRLDPDDDKAFHNRGHIYYEKGDYDLAIADYTEAIKIGLASYKDIYFNARGNAYHKKGDIDLAIADYTEAIRLNPDYAGGFHNRGLAYEKKGDKKRAIADLTEAVRLDPSTASKELLEDIKKRFAQRSNG